MCVYVYVFVLTHGVFHHRWQQPPKLDSISIGKKTEAKVLWTVLSCLELEDETQEHQENRNFD